MPELITPRNLFWPESGHLVLAVPLPPPDNQCHRSGQYSRYPTPAYRDWIDVAGGILRSTLGDWQPDTARWWQVRGNLCLGSRPGDPQNYLKPALDLLSGAQVIKPDNKIVKVGAFWNDDKRVHVASWRVNFLRYPEPCLILEVEPEREAFTPRDWKALVQAEDRATREAAKEAARATKPTRRGKAVPA